MTEPREPASRTGDDGRVPITMRVNGQEEHLRVRPHHSLLELMRNELKLFGVREACGVGMCGACTVLVDGKPISSCLLLAPMADGKDVVSVEGLAGPDGELHPVQRAFVEKTAFQCSYCTPGFVLSTVALLDENPDATEEEARAYLAGNLCRCGSYVKILAAVMAAKGSSGGR